MRVLTKISVKLAVVGEMSKQISVRLSGKDLEMFDALKKYLSKGIAEPTEPSIVRGCIRYVYEREIEGKADAGMTADE